MKQALFPLNTVVFPGSVLSLKIFEQRYLNLIKECMKQQAGFVTVLISTGKEVGDTPEIYRVGCHVDIIDWESLANGLLGIRVQGKHRLRLSNCSVRHDGLLLAETDEISGRSEARYPLPEDFQMLRDTLEQLLTHPFVQHYQSTVNFDSASDICFRLAELLPINNRQKQRLLETEPGEPLMLELTSIINSLQL